nr:methionyl-tRNA formyltransferase [Polycyclovorans algicola]
MAFAGTPAFSVAALDALHNAGHDIAAVFTQPDRPAGRGRKLSDSPVAARAAALGLPVHKPERFRADAQTLLRDANVEVMVVVAYGLILPQAALEIPARGCLNIHASLLPRWRGAAPIQRAIEAGDAETGICIMQMDAGLDTGPVGLTRRLPITDETTGATLHDALATLGASAIVDALADMARGDWQPEPQPEAGACYAAKLSKDEARLDFSQPAAVLARRVRAFNPVPVCWALHGDARLRIWEAVAEPGMHDAPAGTVLSADTHGVRVATGHGVLQLQTWQWPGGTPVHAGQRARAPEGTLA